jgi:type IV pilus assembly protein PilY1
MIMKPTQYENRKTRHWGKLMAFVFCIAFAVLAATPAWGAVGDWCYKGWQLGIIDCNNKCQKWSWIWDRQGEKKGCNQELNCEYFGYDYGECGGSDEPGDTCSTSGNNNQGIIDCYGNCVKKSDVYGRHGDLNNGNCDAYLDCEVFQYDGGDCQDIYDCYLDDDGDDYGDENGVPVARLAEDNCPYDYVDNNDDCDDDDDAINPDAEEVCDGIDNDCNGLTDIEDGLETVTYYQDSDGDEYGNPDVSIEDCAPPEYFVTDNTDCDDTNADIHPGAYDRCEDTIDADCDGSDPECGTTPSICADLADMPLETQVEAPSPIVMLVMDDSGSMAWSVLCPEDNGRFSGQNYYDNDRIDEYWQSQWAGYNGIYYNPDVDYMFWPAGDSSTYEDADKDEPKDHPNEDGDQALSDEFGKWDGVSVKWSHYYVWSDSDQAPYLVNITGLNDSYGIDYYKVTTCGNTACKWSNSYVRYYGNKNDNTPADVKTDRSAIEERQNFANWYQYYHTRQLTAISALANMIKSVQDVQVGLHAINYSVNMIAPRQVNDSRGQILDDLYKVAAVGSTYLQRSLYEVGNYYMGEDSPYSDGAGGECQQVYSILMTDGYWNQTFSSVGNADKDVNTDEIDGFDGGQFADEASNTVADVAMHFYERDLQPDLLDMVPTTAMDTATHQHMVTFAISFGLKGKYDPKDPTYDCPGSICPDWPDDLDKYSSDERNITDLWHAAVNGRGEFLEATNAQQLSHALLAMMQTVSKRKGSGASVAVNSHELKQGTKMYQGTYNSAGWTGDLKAYEVGTDGFVDEDNPDWSAADLLDARVAASGHGDRKIYTMGANGGIDFLSANIGSLTQNQQNYLGDDATDRTNLVNYIRGLAINGFRSRLTRLGDIVHSEPKFVNGYLYVGANDGMFHVFDTSNGQEVFAYIPSFVYPNLKELANPDYSHRYFVDASAFIGYYNNDVLLVSGLGKGGKGYFCLDIDINNPGSFSAADVKWEYPDAGSSNDEIDNMGYTFSEPVIINTETAGEVLIFGNGYDSANARAVLYALNPGTGNMLKMIDTEYGSPNPGDENCNGLSTPVFIDSNNNGKADYAYAGDLRGNVWKFDISGAVDTWDVAYQSGGSPMPLFQARDSDDNPQPITTRPVIKGHCVRGSSGSIVAFGTGMFNAAGDFTDVSTQAVYGIWDWAPEWNEEDPTGDSSDKYFGAYNSPAAGQLSNLAAHSDLSGVGDQLTLLSQSQSGGTVTYNEEDWGFTSSNDINWFNVERYIDSPGAYVSDPANGYHVGWTYTLPNSNSGERVVADPVLWLDYVLIVSQEPTESMCKVGGISYLTALNSCSGAAPDEPFFDTNGDGEVNDEDLIDEEPPSTLELEDFITYPPTMIEEFLYFGPGESYVVDTDSSRVIFWRFLNMN